MSVLTGTTAGAPTLSPRETTRVLSWDVGIRTLSYCCALHDTSTSPAQHRIELWESIDVVSEYCISSGTVLRRPSLPVIVQAVHASLNARPQLLSPVPDVVVIEQQPAGGGNRFSSVNMRVLSHVLQSYFISRLGAEHRIVFRAPSSKQLRRRDSGREYATQEGGACGKAISAATAACECNDSRELAISRGQRYRANKKLVVSNTVAILKQLGDISSQATLLCAGSKKDDLCDAFLLGYFFCTPPQ